MDEGRTPPADQSAPGAGAPARRGLARSLGEFFGHIAAALRADPAARRTIRHDVEEEQRGDVTLRRTTIEEIEVRGAAHHRSR